VKITACRACGCGELEPVVSLGDTPLANSYLRPESLSEPEPRFPLDLVRCPRCSLVQITETVPPEVLFRDYLYFSSFSDTMLQHARELTARLTRELGLGPGSLAAEVASNDGYLLQNYLAAGVPVLGIEPAHNVAERARQRGVRTIDEFFGADLARQLASQGERADVIHANNVLAHVADLNGFVEGFRLLLGPNGVVVSESPYIGPFLERVEYDTIYHEHLCYYSLTTLDRLFRSHGLVIVEAERLAIHGGSLRIFARHEGQAQQGESVRALLAEEAAWGVLSSAPYERFARQVERVRREVHEMVRRLRSEGKRVAAYGAAAKGSTLLNTVNLGPDDLEFVCDRSPHKQGRLMPGVHIPIVSAEELARRQPDYCLLLAWNFADEILVQQAEYRRKGGQFIVPLPEVKVIE
jgi:SAM-dependent methyltransferase